MSDSVQLMLVVGCSAPSQDLLATALARGAASCLLIRPAGSHTTQGPVGADGAALAEPTVPRYDPDVCAELVALAQSHEIAALIANDAAAAKAAHADGCHLDTDDGLAERYEAAREMLGRDAIIGVMPGLTRHMAMALAEAGADYVGYDVTISDADETGDLEDGTEVDDDDDDVSGLALVQWWAEIFESPVVAFCDGDVATCRRVIEAGPPDFVAIPLNDADDLARLDDIAALIAECGQLPIPEKNAK